MKKDSILQNFFCLSSRVAIYVPGTININETCDTSEYIDKTALLLAELFGGSTCMNGLGCWKSSELVKERSTLVYAACTEEDLNKSIEIIVKYCEDLRDELKQEAVALEVNGIMYWI